jgi:hypothetical protein
MTTATSNITVKGLGPWDWTAEDAGEEWDDAAVMVAEWERYGTIMVEIDGRTYEVGCCIGVPEHFRDTARAAGGDEMRAAYIEASYVDASDWSGADVPAHLADAVLSAIEAEAARLWAEARP